MQAGHFGVSLVIATFFDWSVPTVLYAVGIQWLPNADALPVRAGWVDEDFHCSITHTFLFAIIISGLIAMFSRYYGLLTFVSLIAHMLADLPSDVGQPWLWPFAKKKFTIALWRDTGSWGWETIKGSYQQKWPWILEAAVFLFLIYRLVIIYS